MRVVNNINARLCKHGGCTVSVRTRRTRRVTRTRRNIGFRADFVFVLFARCVLPYYRGAKSALGVFVNVFCFFIAFFSAGDGERGSNWDVGTFISPETPVRPSAAGGGETRPVSPADFHDGRTADGWRTTDGVGLTRRAERRVTARRFRGFAQVPRGPCALWKYRVLSEISRNTTHAYTPSLEISAYLYTRSGIRMIATVMQ